MKRLTYFDGGKWRLKIGDTEYSGKAVDRLAAYEETGLEPERIELLIPADDVAEVRHGRWVNTNKEVEQICKCSECGYPISYFWSRTPYCPNCGALMKEEEHEAG